MFIIGGGVYTFKGAGGIGFKLIDEAIVWVVFFIIEVWGSKLFINWGWLWIKDGLFI